MTYPSFDPVVDRALPREMRPAETTLLADSGGSLLWSDGRSVELSQPHDLPRGSNFVLCLESGMHTLVLRAPNGEFVRRETWPVTVLTAGCHVVIGEPYGSINLMGSSGELLNHKE